MQLLVPTTLLAHHACCPLVSYTAYASVTDDDRRRRHTPATVTSLSPTLCVGGSVINYNTIRNLDEIRNAVTKLTFLASFQYK